jgi:hypothetical protein
MQALGITTPSTFHHLRRKYPSAFVVIQQGNGRGKHTLYDKAALDKFIAWRKLLAEVKAIPYTPVSPVTIKKGKQS